MFLKEKTKRQLSLETQTKINQGETKLTKIDGQAEYYSEPMEVDYSWNNICPFFTLQLIQSWTNLNFTYLQVQEWANAFGSSFNPQEHEFVNWLANTKNYSAEEVLNHHNLESLKTEYQQNQLQAQILQTNPYSPNQQNQ